MGMSECIKLHVKFRYFFNLKYKVSHNVVEVQNLDKSGWIVFQDNSYLLTN